MKTTTGSTAGILMLVAASGAPAASLDAIEWSPVPTKTLTLFYPGQSTFQWLRGPEHAGAQAVVSGTGCVDCHSGQEEQKGNSLVKGGKLEPNPPKGKEGVKQVNMQVAYVRIPIDAGP